jgi:Na+-exporting ATPase
MTEAWEQDVTANMEALASQGLRVLALASKVWEEHTKDWSEVSRDSVESDLELVGLIGLYDPPRVETAASVTACHRAGTWNIYQSHHPTNHFAGIAVHMVTGDHIETARAIASQVGIVPKSLHTLDHAAASAMVMTAARFDALSDDEIDKLPLLPLVVARCAPSTKVRMIDALHRRKRFCAMTGDGVK